MNQMKLMISVVVVSLACACATTPQKKDQIPEIICESDAQCLEKGNQAVDEKHFREATWYFIEGLKLNPDNMDLHKQLCTYGVRQDEKALMHIERSCEIARTPETNSNVEVPRNFPAESIPPMPPGTSGEMQPPPKPSPLGGRG